MMSSLLLMEIPHQASGWLHTDYSYASAIVAVLMRVPDEARRFHERAQARHVHQGLERREGKEGHTRYRRGPHAWDRSARRHQSPRGQKLKSALPNFLSTKKRKIELSKISVVCGSRSGSNCERDLTPK